MKKITFFITMMILWMTATAASQSMLQPLPKRNAKEVLKHRTGIAAKHVEIPTAQSAQIAAAPTRAEVVTPPAGLETEKYRLNGYIYDGSSWEVVSRPIQVGWDGDNVYVQGFSVLLPQAWIMGTLDRDLMTVTFPMQYFGTYQGYDSYFFPAMPVEGGYTPIAAVFNYNEDAHTFVLSQDVVCYIVENSSATEMLWFYQYDSEMNMVPDADSVEVPEGLETQECVLSGVYMGYNETSGWFEGDPLLNSAKVGFDGDDIYIQGLCSYLPQSWVKGHREGDNYVIDYGQYFGTFIYQGEAYQLYFMGCEPRSINAANLVLSIDEDSGEITAQNWYAISASAEEVLWYDMLGNVTLKPLLDAPAVPATPEVLYYEYIADEGYGYVMLNVPATDADGSPILTGKLGYRLYVDYGNGPEPYIFTADYYGFDEDVTTIDYTFNDEINFLAGGELVVVYNIADGAERIGVQSVYYGGGETHESEIGWYNIAENEEVEVTLPEGVETFTYSLTAQDLQFGEEYPEDYSADVRVGFDGADVYIQGLSKWLPEAWLKGTMDSKDNTVTFPKHFVGYFTAWGIDMKIVFNGATFAYDPETDTFTSAEGYTSTSTYELEGEEYEEPADVFTDVVITRAADVAAVPAAPEILDFYLNGSYGYELFMNIPLEDVDGNPIFASMLSYQLFKKVDGEVSPIVLEADLYEYATEDMTIIPYLYTDYWEVLQGGETVYVHADGIETWEAIGAKTIYTGGGETNESPITWFDLDNVGISSINADNNRSQQLYDLMGRRVDSSNLRPGIYVRQDGRKIIVR